MSVMGFTKKILFFVFLFSFSMFFQSGLARAEKSELSLTPFLIKGDVTRGQTFQKNIVVANTSETQKLLSYSIQDFLPLGDNGSVEFVPVGKYASGATSLDKWIVITKQPDFELLPGQSTVVEFNITVPKESESGAHFGAFVFTLSDSYPTLGQTLVQYQAATLLIFDLDRSYERGLINKFSLSNTGDHSKVLDFNTEFSNVGTSSLQPKGDVRIFNWRHKEVDRDYVNKNALTVLPSSRRIFANHIPGLYFGWYSADLHLTYGSKRLETSKTISFWVGPSSETVFLWFVLLISMTIGLYLFIKYYNRWLISRHQKNIK